MEDYNLCGGRKMEINLSNEMIYKITCVAFSNIQALKEKEEQVKNSMAVGERQIARKYLLLKDIEKAKADAEEIHTLFSEMLEETDFSEVEEKTLKDIDSYVENVCGG